MVAPSDTRHFEVDAGASSRRLDQYLVDCLADVDPPLSRSQIRRLIDEGLVTVNGEEAKPSSKLRIGDRLAVTIPPPVSSRAEPQDIPLSVLFEDRHMIVIDKPAGLVVHPAPGHPDQTLVNALLAHCDDLSGVGGELRPGIVHRLDKDTSGVMVASKTDAAHASLTDQFQRKVARRQYLAVVAPPPARPTGTIDTLFGRHPIHRKKFSSRVERGKRAITHYQVEQRFADVAALVRCSLETGRTHQIRVHLSDIGHAIVGDPLYGRRHRGSVLGELAAQLGRQALHADSLELVHPQTGQPMRFAAPVPADLARLLDALAQL